jgi:hypothetical protein
MEPKKDVLSPGVRISEDLNRKYEAAIRHYGAGHPGYIRACMEAVIEHCANDDEVILPLGLRVQRIFECPHCRRSFLNSKAKSIQGQAAIASMHGECHPRAVLPEQVPTEEERTAREVLFAGVRVPSELAAKVPSALQRLNLSDDYSQARIEVVEDLVRIAEAGLRLKRPIRLMTEEESREHRRSDPPPPQRGKMARRNGGSRRARR